MQHSTSSGGYPTSGSVSFLSCCFLLVFFPVDLHWGPKADCALREALAVLVGLSFDHYTVPCCGLWDVWPLFPAGLCCGLWDEWPYFLLVSVVVCGMSIPY